MNRFQYITFENPPIGPINSGWTFFTQATYQFPTNFTVQTTGWYIITYKTELVSDKCHSDCAVILSRNGLEIHGSLTKITITESNIPFACTNTVLVDLTKGDNIALMFWSSNNAQIGKTNYIKGLMPNGTVPRETTASILFTKISI